MRKARVLLAGLAAVLLLVSMAGCAGAPETQMVEDDIIAYLSTGEGAMPEMMDADTVADMALAAHMENGGSTTHLRWGDLSGVPLYVVSIYPDLGLIKEGKEIDREEMKGFIERHMDLFADPRVCFGTWFNEDDGKTYIDINVVLADKEAAIELGRQYNQIAIFNLASFEETDTGGDGTPVENLPAPLDRLPEFR